jgi:hypothetical protein
VTILNWVFLVRSSFGTLAQTGADQPLVGRETGVAMEDPVLDEAFMRRYRELLDAEDNAFDELEHAYEDGDREHFETDYAAWQSVLSRKIAFLERRGISVESPFASRSA